MPESETVAAIDIGSNSIKVLVARRGNSGSAIETVLTHTIETRISEGISRNDPKLTEDALKRGTETVTKLFEMAKEYHPREIQIVATSAVRDASNGQEFIRSVADATGLTLRILKGDEEATYICKGLACDPAIIGIDHFIQMDLGGGSLELIRFNLGKIEQAISLQLGAVRLSERFIQNKESPISDTVESAIRSHVEQALQCSGFQFDNQGEPLIATGGAFTVARALLAAQANTTINKFKATLQKEELQQLRRQLTQLPLSTRKAMPHLPASRADIIPTALITIEEVLQAAQCESVTHSFYNLRYGIVAELLNTTN
ncbi:MAG: exopolyphosphatase/guanosine-5'-triphosphate,3'-diphosphate pyrophosphatase [Lentimonas sp.]|jgi:exopolyphosphatase/guanosine-5'-triphosphate,3'-diphosphate pyrophosphatase